MWLQKFCPYCGKPKPPKKRRPHETCGSRVCQARRRQEIRSAMFRAPNRCAECHESGWVPHKRTCAKGHAEWLRHQKGNVT